jgi:opacity protein-like surface antigen
MQIVRAVFILACLFASGVLLPASGYCELYIAGELGEVFPGKLSDGKGTGANSRFTFGDFDLSNSVVYGGKVGYFLESHNWLGFELDGYTTTPHIKQQTVQATPSAVVLQPEVKLRVTTVALNLVFRYPGETFQPYVGGGPGYIYATGTGDFKDSSHGVGFNFLAGLRVFVIQHLAVFGEYKYMGATFKFHNAFGPGSGIEEDYKASHIVAGVSYHF